MGIFDKLFGGKNQNGNGDEGKVIRANSDDCEDIGIVTHYEENHLRVYALNYQKIQT